LYLFTQVEHATKLLLDFSTAAVEASSIRGAAQATRIREQREGKSRRAGAKGSRADKILRDKIKALDKAASALSLQEREMRKC